MEHTSISTELSALEEIRGHRVLLYFVEKPFQQDDATMLYRCLRRMGSVETLDLILHSPGGSINIARKLGVLLRTYVKQLHVLIPQHARSAGALLSLVGNTIVMPPIAELGPIDPHITSAGTPPPNSPPMISAEDVRMFRAMAEEWFGLRDETHRMEMFNILNHRIFPTTLSSFFRSDQQMRRFADELLHYHMPDANRRTRIADRMVGGFGSHDYCILREEARALGLPIRDTTRGEEHLLERILDACVSVMEQPCVDPANETQQLQTTGIMASMDFVAQYVYPALDPDISSEEECDEIPSDKTVPPRLQGTPKYQRPAWKMMFERKENL